MGLFLVIHLVHCGIIHYVVPNNNHKPCPAGKDCHTLSYYASSGILNELSNATLIFMPGEHLLNTSFTLYQFDSLSLIGLGRWIQGSHWSVKESTTVIKCTDDSISAITISFSLKISIADLTITNCNVALYLYNVATTFMWHVSIQNNSNIGLFYNSTFPILYTTILNCSFYQNCLSVTSKGRCAHATAMLNK